MKIRTCRMSGRPVDARDIDRFTAEWQAGYDMLEAKHTIAPEAGEGLKFQPVNMLGLQEDLAKLELELKAKYKVDGVAELPKNAKAWNKLIKDLGSPIMVANPIDKPDEIILVIMDTPLG